LSQAAAARSIVSEANPNFRRWLRLAESARAVRETRATLAEGIHLAQAAMQSGVPIEAILVRRGTDSADAARLLMLLPAQAPRYELAPILYDRIAPVEHGAGLMLVLPVPDDALPERMALDMVILDGIQDPGNAGAILRTAAAAGIRHVLATTGTAALWSPKVVRAAMGAHFHLCLHERVTPEQAANALDGAWFAAVAHGENSLWASELGTGAVGWIFGGEGGGVSDELLALAREQVHIPMEGAVESLNVAAAAAICLFERARRLSPSPPPLSHAEHGRGVASGY
jgi:TrmH family RNA methyltransferase